MHQRFGRLLETATRIELELTVKFVAAREDVRARLSAERQLRAVRSTADREEERLDPRATRCFHRVLDELRMVDENVLHVVILRLHVQLDSDAGPRRFRLGRELAQQTLLRVEA